MCPMVSNGLANDRAEKIKSVLDNIWVLPISIVTKAFCNREGLKSKVTRGITDSYTKTANV